MLMSTAVAPSEYRTTTVNRLNKMTQQDDKTMNVKHLTTEQRRHGQRVAAAVAFVYVYAQCATLVNTTFNAPHRSKHVIGCGTRYSGQAGNGGPQLLVKANVELLLSRSIIIAVFFFSQEVAECLVVNLHQTDTNGAFKVLCTLIHEGKQFADGLVVDASVIRRPFHRVRLP